MGDALSEAIGLAAGAATLEELSATAFPALARALHACPVFFTQVAPVFTDTRGLAGEHASVLNGYLRDWLMEDPLLRAAVSCPHPVSVMEHIVERRIIRGSRAYTDFHAVHDFEHHMLVRFFGDDLVAPGTLAMGFTRGRRAPGFDEHDARAARTALPAFQGAAKRILRAGELTRPANGHGLTPAEHNVLSLVGQGLSNAEIGARLCVSIETVKTHLQRVFRKLGVSSRTQALIVVRDMESTRIAPKRMGTSDGG